MSQQQATPAAQAQATTPVVPQTPAPEQPAPQGITPAPQAQGVAQPTPAPPPTRNRAARGPMPPAPATSAGPGIPALLEIGAANPFSTHFYRTQNFFVPNATHLFHVIGLCDFHMATTHRFLQSNPLWLPVVTQIYISTLWIYFICAVRVNSGYGSPDMIKFVHDFRDYLNIENCLIPGPIVPFFQALASSSAAFDWLGDVLPGLPTVVEMLGNNANNIGSIAENWVRSVPFPAALVDQLIYFTIWTPTAGEHYDNFHWFRNVFQRTRTQLGLPSLGPQSAAINYVAKAQHDSALTAWKTIIGTAAAPLFPRTTHTTVSAYDDFFQFSGFLDGNGVIRLDIFQAVTRCMQTYAHYFNGSTPLKSISTTGLAACIPRAIPIASANVRNWIYPAGYPASRSSGYGQAPHPIPYQFSATFHHADHELEEIAEQYAVTTFINLDLSQNNAHQNGFTAITHNYSGTYWNMTMFRETGRVSVHMAYSNTIAARYHQTTALRTN